MALVSGRRSTLNPNAPLFIPAAFRQVEDFSPEWWNLVTTSTWFHDYWLSQHQEEDFVHGNDSNDTDVVDLLPDTFDLGIGDEFSSMDAQFEEFIQSSETESSRLKGMAPNGLEMDAELMMRNLSLGSPKYPVSPVKYQEKPARYMTPKYSPGRIQQPR